MGRPSGQLAQSVRIAVLLAALLACVLVPFVLVGQVIDAATPGWFAGIGQPALIAVLAVLLLTVDVLLPVPASLVSLAVCWLLGPLWGGVCVMLGHVLAFLFGYALGQRLPQRRLRAFVGGDAWDRLSAHVARHGWFWVGVSRPLPVLSEMVAVSSGALRLPLRALLPSALLASLGVAVVYAALTGWGMQQANPLFAVIGSLLLPACFFLLSAMARAARPMRPGRHPERGVS